MIKILLLMPLFSFAADQLELTVQRINRSMLTCPEKIWRGYSWNNHFIYFIHPDQEMVTLWDGTDGKTRLVLKSDLPPKLVPTSYAFGMLEGRPVISLNTKSLDLGDRPLNENLFDFGTHEFFHYTGQEKWTFPPGGGMRGTLYPQSYTPRIYRSMIYENLKTYADTDGVQKLALDHAAYWFAKWQDEFPDEVNSTTDGYEGSAKFVETMAGAIADLGCETPDPTIMKGLKPLFAKAGWNLDNAILDSEGYSLGGLSGLILQLLEKNPDWQARVERGSTPLQILLSERSRAPQNQDPALVEKIKKQIDSSNETLGQLVDADIKNFDDPEYIRVVLPDEARQGSNFYPIAFLLAGTLNGRQVIPMRKEVIYKDQDINVRTEAKAVFFGGDIACGKPGRIVVVHKNSVQVADDHFVIASQKVKGKMKGRFLPPWLCPY